MWGIVLALLVAAWGYLSGDESGALVFLSATNFLFQWYIITTVIIGSIYFIFYGIAMILGTTIGVLAGGRIGGLLGFLGVSTLSGLFVLLSLFKRGGMIFGAYLLSDSVIVTDNLAQWNMGEALIGAVILVVFLKFFRS